MAQKLIQVANLVPDVNKILKTVNIVTSGVSPVDATYTFSPGLKPGIKTVYAAPTFVPGLPVFLVPNFFALGMPFAADFTNNQFFGFSRSQLVCTRNSVATDLTPSSPAGAPYNIYGINALRITAGIGLRVEETRTNQLLNSTAPATQTTASLGTGTYTLWVNGSGSATPSAGTATISGQAAATQGNPNIFSVTGAGTVVVTVAGSLNAFQLEAGGWGTSFIVTAGATATRGQEQVSLSTTNLFGTACTLFAAGISDANAANAVGTNLLAVGDSTNNNRVLIGKTAAAATLSGVITVGGAGQTSPAAIAGLTQGVLCKAALSCTAGSAAMSLNGSVPTTSAPGLFPTSANLSLLAIGLRGDLVNTTQWNGVLTAIAFDPQVALSANSLRGITTL